MNKYIPGAARDKSYKLYRLYANIFTILAFLVMGFVVFILSTAEVKHLYINDMSQTSNINNPTDPIVSDILRNKLSYLYNKKLALVNSLDEAKKIEDELPYIDKIYLQRDVVSQTVVVKYVLKRFYGAYYDEKSRQGYLIGTDGLLYPVYTLSKYDALKAHCYVTNGGNASDYTELLRNLAVSNIPDNYTVHLDKNTFEISYNNVVYKMGLYKDYQAKTDRLASLAPYLASKYNAADIEYVNLSSAEFPAVKFKNKPKNLNK